MQWRLLRGNIIKKRLMSFAFETSPHISLSCKLVPVQNREYENDLFLQHFFKNRPRFQHVQNYKFVKFFLSLNSQQRLGYKENNTKLSIKSCPKNPGAMTYFLAALTTCKSNPTEEQRWLYILPQNHANLFAILFPCANYIEYARFQSLRTFLCVFIVLSAL